MRTIVLVRVDSYKPARNNPDNIEFKKDIPRSVSDEMAEMLLETGYFMDAGYAPEGDVLAEDFGISLSLPTGANYVLNPCNKLGTDDLNGRRIMFRRNGGLGDVVFLAILAQYIKNKYPKSILWAGINDSSVEFATCFSAFDKVMPIAQALRDDVIHACNYIVEFNEVIGAERSNGEDNLDYFEEHWKRAGLPLPVPKTLPQPVIDGLIGNMSVQGLANDVLARNKLLDGGYAVLLLGTSNPLKRLTVEQLKDIALTYVGTADNGPARKIICLAGRGDRYFESPHPYIRVETELPILVSAEIVRRANVVIGADTGLMQLAGAIGIPTVSVWGPTDPSLSFSHYDSPKVVLTQEGKTECAPCKRIRTAFCPYYQSGYTKCMKNFDAAEIAHFADELVRDNPTNPIRERTSADIEREDKQTKSNYRVAILLDNGGYYTGGGYYAWSLAKILADRPKVEVTVFTDVDVASSFVYARGDVLPRGNRLRVQRYAGELEMWSDTDYYDLVIGTPPFLGSPAVAYAKARGAKSALLVYETPNYIAQYRDGIDGTEDYWTSYKSAIKETDAIWVISREVDKALSEWIPEAKRKTWVVRPTVNTAVADTIFNGNTIRQREENNIVLISRNVKYKELHSALNVIAEQVAPNLLQRPTVHVIGHRVSQLQGLIVTAAKHCDVVFHESITDAEKWKILLSARVLVHPSTFEGFGIPIAEGLYAGATVFAHPLPVVKDEFQNMPVYFTDEASLANGMLECLERWDKELELPIATQRRKFAAVNFSRHSQNTTLASCLYKSLGFKEMASKSKLENNAKCGTELRVAIVSPWNTQCGIADTTKDFASNLEATYRVFSYTDIPTICPDEEYVSRCWDRSFSNPSTLLHYIQEFDPNVVHIQHEHSLFQNEENFFSFLKELKRRGMSVVVTLHTYRVDAFTDRLKDTVDIVTVAKSQEGMDGHSFIDVPLPVRRIEAHDKWQARHRFGIRQDEFVVGTFGMWQEHKGFRELMESYPAVTAAMGDNVKFIISGAAPPKSQYLMECRRAHLDKIRGGLFLLFEDYPPLDEVIERLSACDALVFNYSVAHWSSSSAAIRTAMMAQVPIICSESPMFSEFTNGKQVIKVPFGDTNSLVKAIMQIKDDPALGEKLVKNANAYCAECAPDKIAMKWDRVYRSAVYGAEEDD